ncbi:hypothetical protein JOB18_047587 [Solea senegalensis]|uniref:Uncharacterized protein n=1 Tax=Solea senegalensis TaxID=28829 RepID=A0AAV6PXP3_SOLSE|nr:hypothetical protein JOB18_047587 [Solea senegalensis]
MADKLPSSGQKPQTSIITRRGIERTQNCNFLFRNKTPGVKHNNRLLLNKPQSISGYTPLTLSLIHAMGTLSCKSYVVENLIGLDWKGERKDTQRKVSVPDYQHERMTDDCVWFKRVIGKKT